MVNEVLQWMTLISLAFLVLGLYRQYATAMGIGDSQLLPATMGPKSGHKVSASHLARMSLVGVPGLAIFVSDSCANCHRLLAQVSRLTPTTLNDVAITIVAVASSPDFVEALQGLPVRVVDDSRGELAHDLEVSATPFILTLDAKGVVRAKAVENDIDRILQASSRPS